MDAVTRSRKTKQQPDAAPNFKWRYRLGLVLFIMSYPLLYGTLVAAPFLDMTVKQKALMVSIGGAVSYGLWMLSLPLLGREVFEVLKKKYAVWRRFRRLQRGRNGGERS